MPDIEDAGYVSSDPIPEYEYYQDVSGAEELGEEPEVERERERERPDPHDVVVLPADGGTTTPADPVPPRHVPAASLRGASNQSAPDEAIPVILGSHYIAPRYASLPYTEIAGTDGNEQWLHLSFVVGHAPLTITDLRLGENLVASNSALVTNGAITVTGLFTGIAEIEVRNDDQPMTYYPNKVVEVQFDMTLRRPPEAALGDTALQRTTAPSTTQIDVDFEFPSGLNSTVRWIAEYRVAAGTADWSGATAGTTLYDSGDLTRNTTEILRYTGSVTGLTAGQYDVRCYRYSYDATRDNVTDVIHWMALRSVLDDDPIAAEHLTKLIRVSMKLRSTEGIDSDVGLFNCVANSTLPVYSGTGTGAAEWTGTAITANNAALALYIIRGAANPRPALDALIDWPAFEALYLACDADVTTYNPAGTEKMHSCNAVIDQQLTVRDILAKVLSGARAQLSMHGDIYSIFHDCAGKVATDLITPRNSNDFIAVKTFDTLPHGYRITFVDKAKGYMSNERLVLWDYYLYTYTVGGVSALRDWQGTIRSVGGAYKLATRIENISRYGMNSADEVFRWGRWKLGTLYRRPEVFSVTRDWRSLLHHRGDVVKFGHDVALFGQTGGRIKSVTLSGAEAVSITIDEPVTMVSGDYAIRYLRGANGAVKYSRVNTVAGTTYSLIFPVAIASADAPSVGDIYWFGPSSVITDQLDTVDALIVQIVPDRDFSATVYMQYYSEDIFDADTATLATFDSHVSLPVAKDFGSAIREHRAATSASEKTGLVLANTELKSTTWANLAAAQASGRIGDLFLASGHTYRVTADLASTYVRITSKDWGVYTATNAPSATTQEPILAGDRYYNSTSKQHYVCLSAPTWSADGLSELVIPTYAAAYRGAYPYASLPSVVNEGDLALAYSTTASECGVYKYVTDTWEKQTAPTVAMLSQCWPDISRATLTEAAGGFASGPFNTVADYVGTGVNVFDILAVQTAFITKFWSNEMTMGATGWLKSNNFALDAGGFPSAGAKIDAATGVLEAVGARLSIAEIRGVKWGNALPTGTGLTITSGASPRLTSMGFSRVAYFDATNRKLRMYGWNAVTSVWTLIGTELSLAAYVTESYLTTLSATDIALYNSNQSVLVMFRWNTGTSTWAAVGTPFSLTAGDGAISALDSTHVAHIGQSNDKLGMYAWDEGSGTWSLQGTELSVSIGLPVMCALTSTDIAVYDWTNSDIGVYRWDSDTETWEHIGTDLSIPGNGYASMTALNSTDVVYIDAINDQLYVFRWTGSTFVKISSAGAPTIGSGQPALAALNGTDVAYIDSTNKVLQVIRFSFALAAPFSQSLTE